MVVVEDVQKGGGYSSGLVFILVVVVEVVNRAVLEVGSSFEIIIIISC